MAFQPLDPRQMLNAGGQMPPGADPNALQQLLTGTPDATTAFDPIDTASADSLGTPTPMPDYRRPPSPVLDPGMLPDHEQVEMQTEAYLKALQEYEHASEASQWKISSQLTQ